MSGKCETCRWWERKGPTESEKKAVERFYAGDRCDAIYTMVGPDLAERMVYAAKYSVEVGEGDCHGTPVAIKKNGREWCGQWKFDPKETEEEKTKREDRKKRIDKLVHDEEDRWRAATMKLWERMMKKDKA